MACFDVWERVSPGMAVAVTGTCPVSSGPEIITCSMIAKQRFLCPDAQSTRTLIAACFHHLPLISSFADLPSSSSLSLPSSTCSPACPTLTDGVTDGRRTRTGPLLLLRSISDLQSGRSLALFPKEPLLATECPKWIASPSCRLFPCGTETLKTSFLHNEISSGPFTLS